MIDPDPRNFSDVSEDATIPSVLKQRATSTPERVLFAVPAPGDTWQELTARQFETSVAALAAGFIACGIAPGDRVAIMSRTRFEWTLVDFALWYAGAVPVPIYETSAEPQIAWIVEDARVVAAIVESPGLAAKVESAVPGLRSWTIESGGIAEISTLATPDAIAEVLTRRSLVAAADDIATVIYTSGTTGRPKGCELTHRNFVALSRNASAALTEIVSAPGASTLLFITLAHVFARFISIMCVDQGIRVGHEPDTSRLLPALARFRPTFLLAVPRVFEKVYNASEQRAESSGRGAIFRRAAAVAISFSRAMDAGRIPLRTRVLHRVFDILVYAKLRDAMGGHVRHAVSGSAPLGERLGHFFRGIGLTVLEGYGLTETTAPVCVNRVSSCRIGTVGPALPGASVRISAEGEVEISGIGVFRGYANNAEATAEAFTPDGWLRTGDLGSLDDGYLRITGRSKEIIVTAGGKNVAPAALEERIRSHPIVSQVVVVGEKRPFVGALVTLDIDMLPLWLTNRGVDTSQLSTTEMAAHPVVRERIQAAVNRANSRVSRAESIREWRLLDHDLTEEAGHLTPSLKVKRDAVLRDYADEIDALYSGSLRPKPGATANS